MRQNQGFVPPTLAPDLLQKQYEIAQNQRYAQMLAEDGAQMPQGQMVSGHYVAPSITQYLAQALKSGLSGSIARDMPSQMADMSRSQTQSIYNQFGLGSGSPSPQALAGALGSGGQAGGSIMPSIPGMSREQQAMIAAHIGLPEYLKLAANKGGPINVAPGGTVYNQQTGNVDFVAPQNGIAIQGGQAFAVPGYSEAQASIAGAQTSAQEQARAALDMVDVKMPDGSVQQMSRADAIRMTSQPGAQQAANGQPAATAATASAMGAEPPGYTPPPEVAEARKALGKIETNVNQMTGLIDMALNHPGLSSTVGWQGMIPDMAIPAGTEAADFMSVLDQLKGKAFLDAFESLKGGGAITEREGEAATRAMARLSRTQSEEAFKQSLQEFKGVLESAAARARAKAGLSGQTQQAPAQQQPATPSSRAEYDALPSGAMFRAPDGTIRRKP